MSDKKISEIVCMEYGLELLECFVEELSKIQGLERAGMILPTHKFMVSEAGKEKDALLTTESAVREYDAMKEQSAALLATGKEQLREILNKKNILALLKE